MNRRWPQAVALTTLGVVLAAAPAAASCASPPPPAERIEQAETVFVGTVVELDNDGYWATVTVEEVWKGPDLPPSVEVHGSAASGPDQARTSVDRRFESETRYLFMPHGQAPVFGDNACSGTSPYTEQWRAHRPSDPRGPSPDATQAPSSEPGQESPGPRDEPTDPSQRPSPLEATPVSPSERSETSEPSDGPSDGSAREGAEGVLEVGTGPQGGGLAAWAWGLGAVAAVSAGAIVIGRGRG